MLADYGNKWTVTNELKVKNFFLPSIYHPMTTMMGTTTTTSPEDCVEQVLSTNKTSPYK